jgi:hypothetical protein
VCVPLRSSGSRLLNRWSRRSEVLSSRLGEPRTPAKLSQTVKGLPLRPQSARLAATGPYTYRAAIPCSAPDEPELWIEVAAFPPPLPSTADRCFRLEPQFASSVPDNAIACLFRRAPGEYAVADAFSPSANPVRSRESNLSASHPRQRSRSVSEEFGTE